MAFLALGLNLVAYIVACLTFPTQRLIPGPALTRRWLWLAALLSASAFAILRVQYGWLISGCIYLVSLYLIASVFLVLALVPTSHAAPTVRPPCRVALPRGSTV